MPKVLIIDDEAGMCRMLVQHFSSRGWDADEAGTSAQGILLASAAEPDIVLLDVKLPDQDGIETLRNLKARNNPASIVMMTAYGVIADAVEAIKLGAEQYLIKPFKLAELDALVDRIVETRKLRIENLYYRRMLDHPIVGVSMEIQRLHHMIDLMAENADTTVLLLGESGTGKELAAREIHRRGPRRDRPFMDINCSVLSDTLLESEMFGHERGAFTDAREQKRGLLEVADGGTVFLDEIGEMPMAVQAKLLRVLETRTFKRLGGTRDLHVNVRIIAATNRDLEKAVEQGRYREDLYYRLKVFPLVLPPLRERRDDIPVLTDYFIQHFNNTLKKNVTGFAPECGGALQAYAWPGNVRELRNVVERAMVLTKSTVMGLDLLPREIIGDFTVTGRSMESADRVCFDKKPLREIEREYILKVFRDEGSNRSSTARALGISRSTLQEKLKKYGIT
jgi:two-component system, NtrC family, response regulator AtoC